MGDNMRGLCRTTNAHETWKRHINSDREQVLNSGGILKSIPRANNSQSRGTKDTDIGQRSEIHGEENQTRNGAVGGTTAIY